mgnify:CR=1 FL=1
MIDFTSKQLSWIVISFAGIGGTGYLTLDQKVNEIDKKVAVAIKQLEDSTKQMDRIEQAINRLEEKTYKQK